MAGTIIESQLIARPSSAIRFALATKDDDSAIRRLLRDNPMPGEISISFQREPNYFHGTQIAGAEDQTILAFQKNRLVCVGRCSFRDRCVNGAIRRVGYLSDLRLDSSVQGRFDILRRGYQFFRELQLDNPADFYFTSISAENARSIRFLERGLPGMPRYERLADFVTLLIPVPRRARQLKQLREKASSRLKSANIEVVAGSDRHIYALVDVLNSQAKRFNLSATWSDEQISAMQQHGLDLPQFSMFARSGKIVGCAALWDQRSFKQTVIRGYSRRLSLLRPLLNLGADVFGSTRLPPAGSALAHGFLSPLAVPLDDQPALRAMVESSLLAAASRRLEYLTLGFAATDPRLAVVRNHFPCREYRNHLFQVRWSDGGRISHSIHEPMRSSVVANHRRTILPGGRGAIRPAGEGRGEGDLSAAEITLNKNLIFPEVALL